MIEVNLSYKCPRCNRIGFASIYGNCTACSNFARFGSQDGDSIFQTDPAPGKPLTLVEFKPQ